MGCVGLGVTGAGWMVMGVEGVGLGVVDVAV